MNLPNKLTLARLVMTALFLAVIFCRFPFNETVGLLLFASAGLTDYFDGRIARRDGLITTFGTLMDPLADKILICSAFIAFVGLGWMPAWMVAIVVARELAITGLRLLAANKQIVLAAEGYGKHKTISQIVAIVSILVLISYTQWGPLGRAVFGFRLFGSPWVNWFAEIAKWAAVCLTCLSGVLYLWHNRQLYLSDL